MKIQGINFTGATAVRFGSRRATRVTVASATSIRAVSPPGIGIVDVTVTSPEGTSQVGTADRFSYQPAVTEVQPAFGRPFGGTQVTITGTDFNRATAVRFGSRRATRFVVHSPTSITAVSPPGTGTVDVTVTTPGGMSAASSADLFTYTTLEEWAIFPTPSLGSSGSSLNGISCLSARFCMSVGHNGVPGAEALIEAWNGTEWSPVPAPTTGDLSSPTTGDLSSVSCTSAKFCVAVGSYDEEGTPDSSGPRAVIDTWDGTTWSSTKPPGPASSISPHSGQCPASRRASVSPSGAYTEGEHHSRSRCPGTA